MAWPKLGAQRARMGDDPTSGALVLGEPGGRDPVSVQDAVAQSHAGATLSPRQASLASAAISAAGAAAGKAPGGGGGSLPRGIRPTER